VKGQSLTITPGARVTKATINSYCKICGAASSQQQLAATKLDSLLQAISMLQVMGDSGKN